MSKLLHKTKYLSLFKTKQGFIYAQRRGVNSTAVLCFKKVKGKFSFLIRYQPLPVVNTIKHFKWDDCFACPITGSIEQNQTPSENVINEVYEEANLKISKKQIVSSTKFVSTTQMNETVFCFLVDVTSAKLVKKQQGDGSIFEDVSYNKWLTFEQVRNIISKKSGKLYLSSLAICFNMFIETYGKVK
ncbi:MAG: NUDIX domain-containing protein [Mycoplasma sp.]|nr:NUDIX domain-containing protein [Candidatus Hennigella equi]